MCICIIMHSPHSIAYRESGVCIHVHLTVHNCVFLHSPLWTDNPVAGLSSKRLLRQHLISVRASSRKPCCSRPTGNPCPKNTHLLAHVWESSSSKMLFVFITDRVKDENMSFIQNICVHHLNTNTFKGVEVCLKLYSDHLSEHWDILVLKKQKKFTIHSLV